MDLNWIKIFGQFIVYKFINLECPQGIKFYLIIIIIIFM